MPTVYLKSAELFRRLGKKYTVKEMEKISFEFGIELDGVTSEWEKLKKQKNAEAADREGASREELYEFDIPANRYDLLGMEGLSQALNIFINHAEPPVYIKTPAQYTMTVKYDNTKAVRPYIVCAVLRNINMQDAYENCLALQEKLHANICQNRKLVAIGTHDLDTLTGNFTYDAEPPEKIVFQALKEDSACSARELFERYDERGASQCSVSPYLKLIRDRPQWPIIRDANGTVLSMPPIINGEHSKCHPEQKNMLIEMTGMDLTKLNITLNTFIAAFSQYCDEKFTVEAVKVVYEGDLRGAPAELQAPVGAKAAQDGAKDNDEKEPAGYETPNLEPVVFNTTSDYINARLGTEFSAQKIVELLKKMCLPAEHTGGGALAVRAPITRSDILHPVDIVEDVAIAYGYANLEKRLPENQTAGKEQPINMLTDGVRRNMAMAGFTEVVNWALLSSAENSFYNASELERTDQHAVKLASSKSKEFEVVRTNLLPCGLKTLAANLGRKGLNLPLHIFETGDICLLDGRTHTGARNERRVCLVVCTNKDGSFETVHGMLDRLMAINDFGFRSQAEGGDKDLKPRHMPKEVKAADVTWVDPQPSDPLKDGVLDPPLKVTHQGNPREANEIQDSGATLVLTTNNKVGCYTIQHSDNPVFLEGKRASVMSGNKNGAPTRCGVFGILSPDTCAAFGIKPDVIVSALELNMEIFLKLPPGL